MEAVNIDERLDRLTERHETLTRSVELMNHQIAEFLAKSKEDAEIIRQLVRVAEQDGENIRGLARIVETHERQLTALEGGDQQA